MANVVIRVEGLSKRYRLGQHHGEDAYRSLRDVLPRLLARPLKIFQKNGTKNDKVAPEKMLWALRDISFEVEQGEIVGIIGRNGAGKSTLLKILSGITSPTAGQAQIYGRISALLEVGTGFHGELTGRENVYLNGAILGMRKAEIDHLFEDIVAFAELGEFIDTPLKRYSTGMGMRLAFSVAAHLEPEILIMDEVLAVGDISFQHKCLAKMSEVADSGRTILFVSHNMTAVREFCHRVIVLDHGAVLFDMPAYKAIQSYIQLISKQTNTSVQAFESRWVRMERIQLLNPDGHAADHFFWSESVTVQCDWQVLEYMDQFRLGMMLYNEEGVHLFTAFHLFEDLSPGSFCSCVTIPKNTLNANAYLVHLYMDRPLIEIVGKIEPAARFIMQHERTKGEVYDHKQEGIFKIELPWTTTPVEPQSGRPFL